MLLETIENNNEDIIVFSTNTISTDDNFKIISKKDPLRFPKKLSSHTICELINSKKQKNLIAYRLLTNLENLSVKDTEFGCLVKTNEGEEILYPDPVYAFQELENIMEGKYLPQLKFRLQQVGLTTEPDNNEIFKELFHFDLNADEAQSQDDSVFVRARFKEKSSREFPAYINIYEETNYSEDRGKEGESAISGSQIAAGDFDQKKKISEFNIFNSLTFLKEYIKPLKRKKIFLRFKKP